MKFTLIAVAAAVLPTLALAQEPAIVVTGTRASDPVRADQIGGSITVLDAQALDSRQVRDVSEILRDVPGVAVSRSPGLTQVRLRGSEANHVLVLIDGIEVSDPFQGEFDFGTLIADDGARIEVLRGQQSALYGSDAIGGVIQYITASGREAPGVSARIEGGSFTTANAAVRVGGVSGDFDYALTGTLNTTDGTPNARGGTRDLGSESSAASVKANWTVSGNARLTAVARYARNEGESNDSDFNPGPTFGLITDSPGVRFENRSVFGLIRGEADLLDGRWTHALSAQFADSKRDRFTFGDRTSGSKADRVKGSYETTLKLGGGKLRHQITFALDAERERFQNTDPSGFAFTGRESTDNIGIVGQYELFAGDAAAFGASIRRDENDRFDDTTTYRVQGSYRLASGTRLRAAAGTGVKNPGFYELFGFIDGSFVGNADLRPERSEGWEAGVEQSLFGTQLLIGATYFDSRLKNEIFTVFLPPDFAASPGNRTTTSNQRGVEAFVQARIGPSLRIDGSYTYLKARENGVEEIRRPSHIASVAIDLQAPDDRGGLTLVARYNGEQKDNAFITPGSFVPVQAALDDYVLLNLNGELALTPQLNMFARVENILDEDYEDIFSFATPGRAVYAGVRVRL